MARQEDTAVGQALERREAAQRVIGGEGIGQEGGLERRQIEVPGDGLRLVRRQLDQAGAQSCASVRARATLDLHGAHVGRSVVLMFEDGDPQRPIIMGCLAQPEGVAMEARPGQVEVDTDGERLLVTAKEQLVLRCGKATITLTKAGKVMIQGKYVSSRSSGVNRIKGGSVQLN